MANRCLSYLVLFLALSAGTANAYIHKCVYTFFVKTGEIPNAGTDSKIGLTLSDWRRGSIEITDLTKWGLMENRRDYFELGNLDIFSGREACLERAVCSLKLVSDGSGLRPGWFVEYVEVAISRPDGPCTQISFRVNKWLGALGHPSEVTIHVPCPRIYGNDNEMELLLP